VWDGRVVDWPPLGTPVVRRLQNLPRVAPLPERVWRAFEDCLGSGCTADVLCSSTAGIRRGTLALVTVSYVATAAVLAREAFGCGDVWTSTRTEAAP
jgi:hypothetical protein